MVVYDFNSFAEKSWKDALKNLHIDDLVQVSANLFEILHTSGSGVYYFIPRKDSKSGNISGWDLKDTGNLGLNLKLNMSSEVEQEINSRIVNNNGYINNTLDMFGGQQRIYCTLLNKAFGMSDKVRDTLSLFNRMPRRVESAFNYIAPELRFEVKGFQYPHKIPKVGF